MTQYKDGSLFKEVLDIKDGLADKADLEHTHDAGDITGLTAAVEIAAEAAVEPLLSGKVDKVSGKALSDQNFTATEKSQLASLVAWMADMKANKFQAFSATSDASGNFTFTTFAPFTNPVILATVGASAGAEGYHAHVTSVSGSTITGRAFKNKTQTVVLAGTNDPDDPINGATIYGIVVEGRS